MNSIKENDINEFVKRMFPPRKSGKKPPILFGYDTIKAIHKEIGDDEFYDMVTSMNIIGCNKTIDYILKFKTKYEMKNKKTIAFDFDNVIHKYRKGWGNGKIYDELNDRMLKLIRELLDEGHKVFIMSTRSRFQIKRHFDKLNTQYDFERDMNFNTNKIPFRYETFWRFKKFWNKHGVCGICNHKAVFDILIDDRAVTFNPQNQITKSEILKFKITNYN